METLEVYKKYTEIQKIYLDYLKDDNPNFLAFKLGEILK